MANNYPSPCDKCSDQAGCHGCTDWKIRYLYRQKQINAYAARLPKPKVKANDKLRYEHPDIVRQYMRSNPCAGCSQRDACDIPCAAYLHWYNARMGWIRGRFGL